MYLDDAVKHSDPIKSMAKNRLSISDIDFLPGQVRVDIEDRAHRPALVRISADSVRIHITVNVAQDGANEVENFCIYFCTLMKDMNNLALTLIFKLFILCYISPPSQLFFVSFQEILNLFSKVLNVRLTQLQLARPSKPGSGRKRILIIDGVNPQETFDKMQAALAVENAKRQRTQERVVD
jgi:hypothetical protein